MRSEFGVEEEETIFLNGKAPSEAMPGRATYTTAAAMLYEAWPRASSERRGVYRDESVLTMLFVTVSGDPSG